MGEHESPDADIEEAISALEADDPYLTELNLNNHGCIDSDLIEQVIDALVGNTQLVTLQLANVRFTEDHAQVPSTLCNNDIQHNLAEPVMTTLQ